MVQRMIVSLEEKRGSCGVSLELFGCPMQSLVVKALDCI